MTSSAADTNETETADADRSSVDRSDARAALAQLHFEADFARRSAIAVRITAERARLAALTRLPQRP